MRPNSVSDLLSAAAICGVYFCRRAAPVSLEGATTILDASWMESGFFLDLELPYTIPAGSGGCWWWLDVSGERRIAECQVQAVVGVREEAKL